MMLLQMLIMDILPSEHREESQIQLLFSRVFLCSGMGNFMTVHQNHDSPHKAGQYHESYDFSNAQENVYSTA